MAQATTTSEVEDPDESRPLLPNQACIATMDFNGQEETDLSFQKDDIITIIKPSEHLFWYQARDSAGKEGLVPRNFLEAIENSDIIGTADSVLSESSQAVCSPDTIDDYLPMDPRSPVSPPNVLLPSSQPLLPSSDDPENPMLRLVHEREKKRRLNPGTLVMGTCPFPGEQEGDLPFDVYEEMTLLAPLEDLCWYHAQKTDAPDKKGAIPVSHVRLVYMSDDEDDDSQSKEEAKAAHERLYDDINEFISQSGWYSYPGLAHGKPALQHVLAKKAKLSYELFMAIKNAVYLLRYRESEKVFLGKATVLHEELCGHFECFSKTSDEIREIDDELCHHTDSSGWEITVWPLEPGQELEVEWAKKIVEYDALRQEVETRGEEEVEGRGHGQNEELTFTSMTNFDRFWEWFSPN